MKIVFFSTNRLEVELLCRALSEAGIPCHVRDGIRLEESPPRVPEAELWIQNDGDAPRAFMLCVERDAGFAKRETATFGFEDLFPEAEPLKPELAA
jgi:hypothetical protein